MKKIFNSSKRGIAVILTLCILIGIAGTCVHAAVVDETTQVADEPTQELMPMMASGCDDNDYSDNDYSNNDYSDYDGMTFYSTASGLNAMGIPFSGSGLGIKLSVSLFDIKFEQKGTDLCVFVNNTSTHKLVSWFKVKKW